MKSFHPDTHTEQAGRQAGTRRTQRILTFSWGGGNSSIRTHTFTLSRVTRTTPALVLSVCHPARGQGLIDPPNKWSIRAGRRKRVNGCLLQTQRPGPSVGEFCGAVMCSLTPKSHVSVMFARLANRVLIIYEAFDVFWVCCAGVLLSGSCYLCTCN